jgi:protein-arginine kinase
MKYITAMFSFVLCLLPLLVIRLLSLTRSLCTQPFLKLLSREGKRQIMDQATMLFVDIQAYFFA